MSSLALVAPLMDLGGREGGAGSESLGLRPCCQEGDHCVRMSVTG